MRAFYISILISFLCNSLTIAQNCISGNLFTLSGLTLTSVSASGNQWYINDTLIAGATDQTFLITREGEYKVRINVNNCISQDSIFSGKIITQGSIGNLEAPFFSNSIYEWYDSNNSNLAIGRSFRATKNGTYKVVVNSTATFYCTLNNLTSPCFQFGCEGLSGYSKVLISAVNYPKTVSGNADITFDLAIKIPSCFLSDYTGRVIITRAKGAVPPLRYLDTVYTTLYAGKTNIIPNITMPAYVLDEGIEWSDSCMNLIGVIFADDGECTNYVDPGLTDLFVYKINCLPSPVFSQSDLLLTSVSSTNNRWYLNDTLISTDQSIYITRDGKYKLDISLNKCHSIDSILFKGITYSGAGILNAPVRPGANYQWYLNDVMIDGANSSTLIATDYGMYKVVINICPICKSTNSPEAIFYYKLDKTNYGNPNEAAIYLSSDKTLHISNYDLKSRIMLVDLYGKIIFNKKAESEIDLSGIKEGNYFIILLNENGKSVYTKKISLL